MKMSFRWFGTSDPVKIEYIAQIPGMHGVVSALYDVPVGEVWSTESILALKQRITAANLAFEVVESVPVHEDIKLGLPTRDRYIANYITNIENLARAGVKCICYNFMPIFDWTRTQLDYINPDGSNTLVFRNEELKNPLTEDFHLPGWNESYRKEDLAKLFELYAQRTHEDLWNALEYFLRAVIPAAERCGVVMAIHPDDPPWDIFGIPRIICDETGLDRLLSVVDSPANGLTFCTGSLGCAESNNIEAMIDKYSRMGRIHFMHMRNIRHLGGGSFEETAHFSNYGDLDMVKICAILHKNGYTGYIRPDHGRMIWGESGKPGYGLYDRALGAMYLNGIWETLERTIK